MLLGEVVSLKKTPEQTSTKYDLDKETAMAIESLIKDVVQELKIVKIENPSEMNVFQLESDTDDVSENETMSETPTMKTTTSSMTPLSKSALYTSTFHIDWNKIEEYRAKTTLIKMILLKNMLKEAEDSKSLMLLPRIILT
uniref:Uncharacterized protein n=1 Tax=Romanomermis culicivorax TaxID=13658 RepID=A0A915JBV6_ROMCU